MASKNKSASKPSLKSVSKTAAPAPAARVAASARPPEAPARSAAAVSTARASAQVAPEQPKLAFTANPEHPQQALVRECLTEARETGRFPFERLIPS